MTASISTDILAIFALCYTVYLAKQNIVVNSTKNRIYIAASVTTIILLILEIATILMELSSNNDLVTPHHIANIIGFSLSPVVPYILLSFFNDEKKPISYYYLLALPLYLNAFMCIFSFKSGWIYFINAQNQYTRGNLFLLPTIVSMFYYMLMLIEAIKNSAEYDKKELRVLVPLFLMPILGIVVQLIFRDILLIWGSISISLLLYYIFLRELHFTYDVQTGLKNRSAFEKEMEHYRKAENNAIIIVIDINNLKTVNDKYGHNAGDETIVMAAKIIQESFVGISDVFRIGGDEFCVICTNSSRELADQALANLEHSLITINQTRDHRIVLAYGYAFYNKLENESIYATLAQADKAMYTHKAKLKGICGEGQTIR